MARLVEQATSRQSPAEAAVARFAKIYTPIVLLSCILLAFVPWSNPDADRKWWVYLSLQVLVTACPCALVLSTPVTIVSALARAAQVGVLIKGGVVLETLRDVKVVTLDKTGTLTVGAFLVDEVITVPKSSFNSGADSNLENTEEKKDAKVAEKDVLRLVGSLERGCNHPLAAALVGRAAARGVACDAEVHGSSIVPGFGIMGIVDGHAVRAGTSEFIRQSFRNNGHKENSSIVEISSSIHQSMSKSINNGEELVQLDADAARFEGGGVTTCFIAVDGQYVACITARDSLRPEAAEAVASLRALGVTPAMLTGDNNSVATAIGAAAGIERNHIHASLLPQDKLDLVSAYNVDLFQNHSEANSGQSSSGCGGFSNDFHKIFSSTVDTLFFWKSTTITRKPPKIRVAHVGDGVNDAPALAAADVGIAMGVAGAAAALEAGDVALFTNDLRVVPALQRLARAAGNKITFNITLSVVTKIAVLVLAALGKFTLFGAVLVDVGTALLVTLNGLTLLRYDFGLGTSPAGCVGAAAAAAAAGADGHGQCCSDKGCCAPKMPEKETTTCSSSSCKSKACCSSVAAVGNHGAIESSGGKACCDEGAEEAQQGSCCDHDHHGSANGHHHHSHHHENKQHSCHEHSHTEHTHDTHNHSHSHSDNKKSSGGCCGNDHDHSHHHHHPNEEKHNHSHNHSTHTHTPAKSCSTKSCCSGHTHH
jgi:Zn2+/Cd2+-exporting ATPase